MTDYLKTYVWYMRKKGDENKLYLELKFGEFSDCGCLKLSMRFTTDKVNTIRNIYIDICSDHKRYTEDYELLVESN